MYNDMKTYNLFQLKIKISIKVRLDQFKFVKNYQLSQLQFLVFPS